MHTQYISYVDGALELEGYLAHQTALDGPRPGVLIAHAWGGQSDFERRKAEQLAELGYVGFALDLYGKGVRGSGPEENARLMQPFLEDRAMLRQRVQAALVALRELDQVTGQPIAAIGFCFGGLCVLDLARSGADVAGVVSFHGLFGPPELPDNPPEIRARILALHGNDDPMVPPEQVLALEKELTEAGADWQVHVYGGAMHAFTNPEAADPKMGTVYLERADRRSWESMKAFLAELFA